MQHKFRNYALLILGLIIVISLVVFIFKPGPTVQWSKTFGEHSGIRYVQQTTDSGYIIIVTTYSQGTITECRMVKIDADGNKVWDKTFGNKWLDESGYLVAVQSTADDGYILSGIPEWGCPRRTDAWLIKTDAAGNKLWDKTLNDVLNCYSYSIQQTADGGYILCGQIWSTDWPEVGTSGDIQLIKIDTEGNKVWDNIFGGDGWDDGDSVQQTTDGGYIICGSTEAPYKGDVMPDKDIWLIKTDANGNKLWDKKFDGLLDDYGGEVQQTTDGGYILCGSTGFWGGHGGDIWLIKTDANGDKLWDKTFGGIGDDQGYSVQQTTDGGYIICGNTIFYLSWIPIGDQLVLIKTDTDGDKLWSKTLGGIFQDYRGSSVRQTSDGGYIIDGGHGQSSLLFKIAPVRSR